MPPPVIPPMIQVPQGRPSLGEQLLLSMSQQALGGLLGAGLGQILPGGDQDPGQLPVSRQRQAEETVSMDQLLGMGRVPTSLARDVGTAEVPTEDVSTRLEDFRRTAPERLKVALDEIQTEEERERERQSREALLNMRQMLVDQLESVEDPGQQEIIQDRLQQFDARMEMLTAAGELGAERQRELVELVAPDLEARMDDAVMLATTSALRDGVPVSDLINSALGEQPDSMMSAAVLENMGYGELINSTLTGRMADRRALMNHARGLKQDRALDDVPLDAIVNGILTGELDPRHEDRLREIETEMSLSRQAARAGIAQRAIQMNPLAATQADRIKELASEDRWEDAIEAYTNFRSMMLQMPGVTEGVIFELFPNITVENAPAQMPTILQRVIGGGAGAASGGLFGSIIPGIGSAIGAIGGGIIGGLGAPEVTRRFFGHSPDFFVEHGPASNVASNLLRAHQQDKTAAISEARSSITALQELIGETSEGPERRELQQALEEFQGALQVLESVR